MELNQNRLKSKIRLLYLFALIELIIVPLFLGFRLGEYIIAYPILLTIIMVGLHIDRIYLASLLIRFGFSAKLFLSTLIISLVIFFVVGIDFFRPDSISIEENLFYAGFVAVLNTLFLVSYYLIFKFLPRFVYARLAGNIMVIFLEPILSEIISNSTYLIPEYDFRGLYLLNIYQILITEGLTIFCLLPSIFIMHSEINQIIKNQYTQELYPKNETKENVNL